MNPQIQSYLDEYGGRYTREALREQLVQAGLDPAEVDAALDAWAANRQVADAADQRLRRTYWRWTAGVFVMVWLGVVLLFWSNTYVGVVAIVLGAAMIIGLGVSGLIGRLLLRSAGLIALAVPVVSALLIGGSCVGLMGGVPGI